MGSTKEKTTLDGGIRVKRNDQNETLLDRWTRRAKDNPIIAIGLLVVAVIGGLATFTGSLKSLVSLFQQGPESNKGMPAVRVFQIRPELIRPGDAATIEWNVDPADNVRIDGGIGVVPLSGSRQVSPSGTTTYTLTANNHGSVATSTVTLRVETGPAFDGELALSDVFVGDAGWKMPPDPAFRGSVGNGRFRMEWIENRSGRCVTRDLAIPPNQDFSVQVTAQAIQPTDFSYGLCWTVSGGKATYMLYVSPVARGSYHFVRDEVWEQVAADGQPHPYGGSVNLLDPADVNHRFLSSVIHSGTAANVLTVVRRADKLDVYINHEFCSPGQVHPRTGGRCRHVHLRSDRGRVSRFLRPRGQVS
jgi:hypothetical protein